MPRNKHTTRMRKERFLEGLGKSMAIATQAAKISGVDVRSHYLWLKEDPEYAERVAAVKDMQLDFAESALMKRIQDGSDTAIIFYLKTQARHRGYIERKEITLGAQEVFVMEPDQKGLQATVKRLSQGNIEDADEVHND